MNEDLKQKIIKDLQKSGFGSEMRAIRAFNAAGFRCTTGYGYLDKDEQKTREIDFTAYRPLHHTLPNDRTIYMGFHLAAEVKKSESPWIVFKEKIDLSDEFIVCAWRNIIHFRYLPSEPSTFANTLNKNSLLSRCRWRGYGIHQAFKDPDMPSRWYSAFSAVSKAVEHCFESNSSGGEVRKEDWVTKNR